MPKTRFANQKCLDPFEQCRRICNHRTMSNDRWPAAEGVAHKIFLIDFGYRPTPSYFRRHIKSFIFLFFETPKLRKWASKPLLLPWAPSTHALLVFTFIQMELIPKQIWMKIGMPKKSQQIRKLSGCASISGSVDPRYSAADNSCVSTRWSIFFKQMIHVPRLSDSCL